MNIQDIREKIKTCKAVLKEIQSLTSMVKDPAFQEKIKNEYLSYNTSIEEIDIGKAREIESKFEMLKKSFPDGLELDHNFIRHISFNEVTDWRDIHSHDIEREFKKIEDYEKNLILVEKVEKLHPKVASTTSLLMIGEYDAALTKVFKSIETEVRNKTDIKDKIGVSLIGYVFSKNPPILKYKDKDKQDCVRNFLMGVVGFYRNTIMHDELPMEKSNMDECFQQLVIASEAHKMIDCCSVQKEKAEGIKIKDIPF